MLPGGSAQISGVVRTGDRLISINGLRVVGFKHREVVQLLDQAAHTVGQVTLGLQRPVSFTLIMDIFNSANLDQPMFLFRSSHQADRLVIHGSG